MSDVCDPQIARRAIDAEAEWIAQAQRPDLVPDRPVRVARRRDEWIVRWDPIRGGERAADVETQHLAEERVSALCEILGIVHAAAVAEITSPERTLILPARSTT